MIGFSGGKISIGDYGEEVSTSSEGLDITGEAGTSGKSYEYHGKDLI